MYKEIYEHYKELDKCLTAIESNMTKIYLIKRQLRDAITTEQRLMSWAQVSHEKQQLEDIF